MYIHQKILFCMFILFCLSCKITKISKNYENVTITLSDRYGYNDKDYRDIINDLDALKKFNPVFGKKVNIDEEKFSVCIEDANRNGKIDNNLDKLHITGFDEKNVFRFSECSNSTSKLEKLNFCNINDKTYLIEVLDSINWVINLKRLDTQTQCKIYFNDSVPKGLFLRDVVTNKVVSIDKSTKKFQYFYFWGTWCRGCHVQTKILKEFSEKNKDIEIIGMNCNEKNIENAVKYIKENNLKWVNLESNKEVNRYFHQNGFPDGVLYKNGRFYKSNIVPIELLTEIEKNNKIIKL